jgi:hypothetical protein
MAKKPETAKQRRERLDDSKFDVQDELKRVGREEYERLVRADHQKALDIIAKGRDRIEEMGLRSAHEYTRQDQQEQQEEEQDAPRAASTFAPLGESRRRRRSRPPHI